MRTPGDLDATTLHVDLDWEWSRPRKRRNLPKGEPRHEERPVVCTIHETRVTARAGELPFPDAEFERIECGTIFGVVRDDEGLARELVRVLRPGGELHLRAPATGPLGGLDAYNLAAYLADITGRGTKPFETAEAGWRRHFSVAALHRMFGSDAMQIVNATRSGLALGELVRFFGMFLFRWLLPSRNGYRRVEAVADRVERLDRMIEASFGFWIEMTLRRAETASRGNQPAAVSDLEPGGEATEP